jgi:hypothetical protein
MKSLKILFVGNSFAVDTMEHAANIAFSLGVERIKFGTLYIGGCPIELHYENAMGDLPAYTYYTNVGEGWEKEEEYKISDAVKSEDWDWIAIQHGSKNGNRYTLPGCYEKLTPLIQHLKELASEHTKIAFNLTWMGESTVQRQELLSYGGNVALMREKLEEVTREMVVKNPLVDLLTPTGTAIENARTSRIGLLTRDCYHLSMDKGRYIAALTFIGAITGLPIDDIQWTPDGVDEYARLVAIESAKNAMKFPLEITQSKLI